jgi:hypothetical protein
VCVCVCVCVCVSFATTPVIIEIAKVLVTFRHTE